MEIEQKIQKMKKTIITGCVFASIAVAALFSFTCELDQKDYTVIIDAGHGGIDHGCSSKNHSEKEITMAISNEIKALSHDNIRFIFTREQDCQLSLSERKQIRAYADADLYLSLHVNSGPKKANGFEIYYPKEGPQMNASKQFADQLSEDLSGLNFRKTAPAGFMVLRDATCPSILLELGFITNKKDLRYLKKEKNRTKLAKSLIASIDKTLGALAVN